MLDFRYATGELSWALRALQPLNFLMIRNARNRGLGAVGPSQRVRTIVIKVPMIPGAWIARHVGPNVGPIFAVVAGNPMRAGMSDMTAMR